MLKIKLAIAIVLAFQPTGPKFNPFTALTMSPEDRQLIIDALTPVVNCDNVLYSPLNTDGEVARCPNKL